MNVLLILNPLRHLQTNKENSLLVTYEPYEFEKQLVEAQNFKKFTSHLREIYEIYLKPMKENWKITTCNQLDLGTLGFGPIMPNCGCFQGKP